MQTKNITLNLFEVSELSENAKGKVRDWVLSDWIRETQLTDIFAECYLNYFFPNSDLKVQWSISSCQGDGVNVYGILDIEDILNNNKLFEIEEHADRDLNQLVLFTPKEKRRLAFYFGEAGLEIKAPENQRYCYCIADRIEFADELIGILEDFEVSNIDKDLIKRMEIATQNIIGNLCGKMKTHGYEFLYEISDAELEDECAANEWLFDIDGNFAGSLVVNALD